MSQKNAAMGQECASSRLSEKGWLPPTVNTWTDPDKKPAWIARVPLLGDCSNLTGILVCCFTSLQQLPETTGGIYIQPLEAGPSLFHLQRSSCFQQYLEYAPSLIPPYTPHLTLLGNGNREYSYCCCRSWAWSFLPFKTKLTCHETQVMPQGKSILRH